MTNTIVATTAATAYSDYMLACGRKPNVTRIRRTMQACAMVADHYGASLRTNNTDTFNPKSLRSYVLFDCYICGKEQTRFEFEHIDNDGLGVAGTKLADAICDGTQPLSGINLSCSICNGIKHDEALFDAAVAKQDD